MSSAKATRRAYGSGSILVRNGSYYGKWRAPGGEQIKRKIGPVRQPGTSTGLTKAQAEKELRRLMSEIVYVAPAARQTFEDVAAAYIVHVETVRDRKATTVDDYRGMVRKHLAPFFGSKGIDRITDDDVLAYMATKKRAKLAVKTIRNHLIFAHGVFAFARKKKICERNPVADVELPAIKQSEDFRYLEQVQLDAIVRAVPDDVLGRMERVLYPVAAMTGLRQGELVALRWRDVDWAAGWIRVRQNFTRREWGTPKSKRSTRKVPLADAVAALLDEHSKATAYQGPDDLVFCHPETGNPYDASKLRKRYYDAMRTAGLGHLVGTKGGITFHSLRHTYGTRMASVGTPLRTLQEWMGHASYTTTEKYADYAPDPTQASSLTARAFGPAGTNPGTKLKPTGTNSDPLEPRHSAGRALS